LGFYIVYRIYDIVCTSIIHFTLSKAMLSACRRTQLVQTRVPVSADRAKQSQINSRRTQLVQIRVPVSIDCMKQLPISCCRWRFQLFVVIRQCSDNRCPFIALITTVGLHNEKQHNNIADGCNRDQC